MQTPIQSMTGFGTATVQSGTAAVRVDIRSVNGKGLDIRLRIPQGLEAHEAAMRKAISDQLGRGSLQVSVVVDTAMDGDSVIIDEQAFLRLASQAKHVASLADIAPPTTDTILALRGVVVQGSGAQHDPDQLGNAMLDACHQAVAALAENRTAEGQALSALLNNHLSEMERLVGKANTLADKTVAALHERLLASLQQILEPVAETRLDADRLHAEVALLATRHDIREELDRLAAHIAASRQLMDEGGMIGRKLEFLCQEFNREANTLCAKSAATAVTEIGLSMKAIIDQMREQAANVA